MTSMGPSGNFKPGWRQGWWWRERVPGVVALVVVAVLIAVVIGVVFITDDHDDGSSAGRTSDSRKSEAPQSASPRPSEEPPRLPEVAHKPTQAGIEATVRFEIAALNYAQRTGDFEPLQMVLTESCDTCNLLITGLKKSLQNGAYYVDAEFVLKSIEPTINAEESGRIVGYAKVLEIQPKEGILLDRSRKEIRRRTEPDANLVFTLNYVSNMWKIQAIAGSEA